MDRRAIHEQIERILRSRSFAGKGQLRKLLEVLHQNMQAEVILTNDQVIGELWPTEIRTKRSADVATERNTSNPVLAELPTPIIAWRAPLGRVGAYGPARRPTSDERTRV